MEELGKGRRVAPAHREEVRLRQDTSRFPASPPVPVGVHGGIMHLSNLRPIVLPGVPSSCLISKFSGAVVACATL